MQNGKTIKTWKNVEFNVDIFKDENRIKKLLTNVDERDILIKLIYKTEMSNVKKAKNKFKKVVDKRLRMW